MVVVDGQADMAQLDLETGADQWLPNPLVPGALVGSVKAALRRSTVSPPPPPWKTEILGSCSASSSVIPIVS
jgi:DNA-binding response OmpR family regulator